MILRQAQDARQMKKVMEVIRRHRRFSVTSHINPEGDALGSAIGLGLLLKRLGKQVVLAQDGGIPPSLKFLPGSLPGIGGPGRKISAEVSFICDVPVLSRIGSIQKVIQQVPLVVCIDHHVSNQRFADINWVDPHAAAVGEMIYRLYKVFRLKPRKEEALCLYTSLVSDTGSFRYMNTTPAVHEIAAELIKAGVSPLKVSQNLYETHSVTDLKFLGTVLRSMRHSPDGRVAWLEIPWVLFRASKAKPEVIDEIVNYPRSVRSAEVAFVMRETPDRKKVRVSLRSKGRIDVNQIARHFNGGGHMAASGCVIEGSLSQARNRLLKVTQQAIAKKFGRTASHR